MKTLLLHRKKKIADTPHCPKGKPVYELAEDRKEDERDCEEMDKEV